MVHNNFLHFSLEKEPSFPVLRGKSYMLRTKRFALEGITFIPSQLNNRVKTLLKSSVQNFVQNCEIFLRHFQPMTSAHKFQSNSNGKLDPIQYGIFFVFIILLSQEIMQASRVDSVSLLNLEFHHILQDLFTEETSAV